MCGVTDQEPGSPQGEPLFLAIGKLGRPHGVKGEIILYLLTDFPERLKPGVQVYLGDQHLPIKIRARRAMQGALLLKFDGYDSPETVGEISNQFLFVRADDRPSLPDGEYYHHQILGLHAYDERGRFLGKVTEILTTGSNDVYVVQSEDGSEILLPATNEVILDINLQQGLLRVHIIPGLIPGE